MTTDYARGFRAGIEAAARLHDRLSEWAYEAEEDPKCGQMHRDFAERIRALAPAAPEPLFAPREYEADDFGPIGDAARRICSHVDGDARENVYRAAKRELAALQPAPVPSEAERMPWPVINALEAAGAKIPPKDQPSEAEIDRVAIQIGEPVTLAECPVGLFLYDQTLALKTEYGDNEGRIDAYIVETGEFFWGGTISKAAQRQLVVRPVAMSATLAAMGRV